VDGEYPGGEALCDERYGGGGDVGEGVAGGESDLIAHDLLSIALQYARLDLEALPHGFHSS